MKNVVKILCLLGGLLALAKLSQILLDYFYEKYGKNYVSSQEID